MQFDRKLDYRSNMPSFTDEVVEQNREILALLDQMAEEKMLHLLRYPWHGYYVRNLGSCRFPEHERQSA